MVTRRRIVVRGERNADATAALRWAVLEAERTRGDVVVVQPFDRAHRADLALERDLGRARRDARYRAQSWVVEAVADLEADVPVTVSTPDGSVLEALQAAAGAADLLVVADTDPELAQLLAAGCSCPVAAVSSVDGRRHVRSVGDVALEIAG
jgi:hypothetical protein